MYFNGFVRYFSFFPFINNGIEYWLYIKKKLNVIEKNKILYAIEIFTQRITRRYRWNYKDFLYQALLTVFVMKCGKNTMYTESQYLILLIRNFLKNI
jgi:hypothetical protein